MDAVDVDMDVADEIVLRRFWIWENVAVVVAVAVAVVAAEMGLIIWSSS